MIKLFSNLFFPLFGIVAFQIANNSVSAQSVSNVSVIDLLVAYSPGAANAGQGGRGMRALIEAAVREMNDAHARSWTKVRFNLVGIQRTQEDQFGSVTSSNLRAIRDPVDGNLDEIQGLRDEVGADKLGKTQSGRLLLLKNVAITWKHSIWRVPL